VVALGLADPAPWAGAMGILELAGGIMLALGLLTRPAALLLAAELLAMIFAVHSHNGFRLVQWRHPIPGAAAGAVHSRPLPRRRALFARSAHRQGVLRRDRDHR
jgi:uncharacterized membrane protein YphA (DoxX/SURF4 family)